MKHSLACTSIYNIVVVVRDATIDVIAGDILTVVPVVEVVIAPAAVVVIALVVVVVVGGGCRKN